MKVKKEYLLLILIIVVLSVYLTAKRANHDDPQLPKLMELDSKAVNRMTITKKDGAIELSKKDEQWIIAPNDYPADTAKVKNMINAAAKLTATALVSEAGIYERYELDDAKQTTIKVFKDQDLQREFSIGKAAPTFQHTFLRLVDDDNVYHARGNLTKTFNQTIDGLRDKKVLSFDKAQISELEVSKASETLIITKKEVAAEPKDDQQSDKEPAAQKPKIQWTAADGRSIDTQSIESLLSSFSGLTCDKFMADDAKSALENAAWTLTFKTGQDTFRFSVFGKDDQTPPKYQATSSVSPFAFLLTENRIQSFEKKINQLFGKESAK